MKRIWLALKETIDVSEKRVKKIMQENGLAGTGGEGEPDATEAGTTEIDASSGIAVSSDELLAAIKYFMFS